MSAHLRKGRCVASPLGPSNPIYNVQSARLALCLLPEGIQHTGSDVTQWRDSSANANHGTASGGCLLDTSGPINGVIFDGVNSQISGSLSETDQPGTLFIVKKMLTNPSAYQWVYDSSDTGNADRSIEFRQVFGSAVVYQGQNSNSTASYLFGNTTDIVLHRGEYTTVSRSIWENGVWKGSSGVDTSSPRTATAYNLGKRLDGTFPWNGVIYAVLLYEGAMNEVDRQNIQNMLLDLFGAAHPYVWPDIGAASDTSSDPRFIVPPVLDAIVGRDVEIWKDSVHLRDGQDANQVASSDLLIRRSPSDRWRVRADAAGSYGFTITEGSSSQFSLSTTIQAVPMLDAGAPKRYLLFVGDSNTARMGSGLIEYLGNLLGSSRMAMLGLNGPNSGYTYKHQGKDSWSWASYGQASGLAGDPSPFFNGGVLDIPNYLSQLSHNPTHIFWNLGQNDVYSAPNVETAIDAAFGYAEMLISAFSAAVPGVKHAMSMNWCLAMDPALGWGTKAARYDKRTRVHRYAERLLASFSGREAENIYIVPTFWRMDPVTAWADVIHMNSSPGHVQTLEPFLAWLVAHWT